MENINKIKKWVVQDGIVKRGNKQITERAIELTCNKVKENVLKELDRWMKKMIKDNYMMKRCPEYEKGCANCEWWKYFDKLNQNIQKIK